MKRTIVDLRVGEQGVLGEIRLPPDEARPLMEHGFLPGAAVVAAGAAPAGDPLVYRVDGTDVALRASTARFLYLRRVP